MNGRLLSSLLFLQLFLSCGGSGGGNSSVRFAVSSTSPSNDGYLAIDGVVRVTFTKAAEAGTINDATFSVIGVAGTVEYDTGTLTATFTPSVPLTDGAAYTATVSAVVTDTSGQPLAEDYVWEFTAKITPSPPTALSATGSLRKISLDWTASPSSIDGYKVYRSEDGVVFNRINETLVPAGSTTYEDTISSPAGDGLVYTYRVRAYNGLESSASNSVRQIHGTRLASSYSEDPGVALSAGVYVIEGTTRVNGADFTVPSGYKVYLFDNSTLKIEQGHTLLVEGLFAVAADADHPATLSGHDSGGSPTPPAGFLLSVADTSTDYDPATGRGTLFQYATIDRLQCTGEAVQVGSAGPRFFNTKIDFNCAGSPGAGYLKIKAGSSAGFVQNDILDGTFEIAGSLHDSFHAELNDVQNGAWEVRFSNYTGPGVSDGQFANNRFDGGVHQVRIENVSGTGVIPLGGNFWASGTPAVSTTGSAGITVDFDAVLSAPPDDVGTTW